MARPVGVPARPPMPVSRRSLLIALPTSAIASMTSSAGMCPTTPANAMSAAETAFMAPMTLRLMQGISTRPATGSQTRPSRFVSAMANASAHCSAVPPLMSTSAAAAMPLAAPTSA